MITPRTIRLLRVPDLQTLHGLLATRTAGSDPLEARARAVLVPTRGAAESLRRTLENRLLVGTRTAAVLPDLLTRGDFYNRLHQHLTQAPPLLSEFEREVLIRRAARVASETGAAAPFRLRAGLIVEILSLYDELRRRGRSVADFDRLMTGSLEPVADTDRGAERMLRQTRFLSAVYEEFERRVAGTGRLDEHALRAQLLAAAAPGPYRQVVVTVGDQAADAMGLWPADYDLLARLPGLDQVEIMATEAVLGTGLHQRMHDLFPGIEEERVESSAALPALLAPEVGAARTDVRWFVSRDREEELSDIVRAVKLAAVSERTAIAFQRPLPYLYLARSVFADAEVPYQALDALPLAAEPFAAALDLVFEVAMTEATRAPLVDLLASPHWGFELPGVGAAGEALSNRPVGAAGASALDALLREVKYLGGWDRLYGLIAESGDGAGKRAGRLWQRAEGALRAAAAAAGEIREAFDAPSASGQVQRLVAFIRRHERLPDEGHPVHAGHVRARAAILGALAALAAAHAAHDDEPLLATELSNIVRRWIEGQTFSPRTGSEGVALLDTRAAAFADVDDLTLVGLVDADWPERSRRSIFYPASLLGPLGWPNEFDRLTAARARFFDLLRLPRRRVSISTFTLEDDAIVAPSALVEELDGCGLAVERVARVPPRVFIQEALREEPIEPAAVHGVQAEWLALRAGRTPGADAAYHGEAGARAPAVYAVSHVERYLDCPFKYYSSYVLGLDEERNEDAGLSPRERGQFLHEIFQRFFVRWQQAGRTSITGETLPMALALFEDVVDAHLAPLSDADRALERTYLLGSAAAPGLAERAFAFEIEQGVGVRERLIEHVLDGAFVFATGDGPRTLHIRGKADRIDLLDDGTIRVVDYKLGRAPKAARALQLPVYGVCASQQLEGRDGRSWPLSRAAYVAFKEKNAFVALGNTPAATTQALEDGQRRMVAAVDAIERGQFPVDPDEPFFCTRCGYAGVCRKDYVGDE